MGKFGSILDLGDIRNYTYENFPYKSNSKLPDKYKVKNTVLRIKDQGQINACVGFACSSLIEIFNKMEMNFDEPMSPFYIYGKHRNYQDEGMYLGKTLNYLTKEGTVSDVNCPLSGEMPEIQNLIKNHCNLYPELVEEAKKSIIGGYVDLVSGAKDINENIKHSLYDYDYPVIAVTDYFGGYHCILIDGYDDNTKKWSVPNSWGIDNGDHGYDYIDYGTIVEAYLVLDSKSLDLPFLDVPTDHPYYKEIKNLFYTGVIEGRSKDKYQPDDAMTRAEYALATYRNNKVIQDKIDKIYNLIKPLLNK